jgi:hypothetical protein
LARRFSEEELQMGNADRLSWANGNLMELYVLAPMIPDLGIDAEEAARNAMKYAYDFRSVTESRSINLHSTRRQIARYPGFFAKVNPAMTSAADLANQILRILPESRKY